MAVSMGLTLELKIEWKRLLLHSVAAFILLAFLSSGHCSQPGLVINFLGGCADQTPVPVGNW